MRLAKHRTGVNKPAMRSSADASCVETEVTLGSLTLANPIVTASGTYGHGAEVAPPR